MRRVVRIACAGKATIVSKGRHRRIGSCFGGDSSCFKVQAMVRATNSRSPQSSASTGVSSVPSSSIASLVQSAAKLEGMEESRLFPKDDEYEHTKDSLESLRRETLQAMPDEQERKRFLGCLASVLATLYAYDDFEEDYGRKRRHQVYSDFLSSAAELLQLDPTQSRCFVPMLSSLLHPKNTEFQHPIPRNATLDEYLDRIDHLRSFLEDMRYGIRSLALFLTQYLLHSPTGYDARIRHALRTLGVLILWHDECETSSLHDATRKFEQLERYIADKLIQLSEAGSSPREKNTTGMFANKPSSENTNVQRMWRGLAIGGTAVAAGTLFAISGGLAAPVIASTVATVVGTTTVAGVATLLTTTAAVTTIFGVGGGGLVAYKMQRRTMGLTEFTFHKQTDAYELSSTICISGWLSNRCDFERPWGLQPKHPPIGDRVELLERFYSVYKPSNIARVRDILHNFRGRERELSILLRKNYGRDPHKLFPLGERPILTLDEKEIVDRIFEKLGCVPEGKSADVRSEDSELDPMDRLTKKSSYHDELDVEYSAPISSSSFHSDNSNIGEEEKANEDAARKLKHLSTVWDYQQLYGGELYTVKWESHLLEELCDSVVDLAADVITGATSTILRHTALAALMAAVALPVALNSVANMIDGTWTLVVERADAAGRELAQSLVFSNAGNRPVSLVGFSFGARVIYSCLKELSRLQEEWEEYHLTKAKRRFTKRGSQKRGSITKNDDGTTSTDFENMREPASIVNDAILMGLPNHLSLQSWGVVRQVVAGRLVNCFSQKDLILSLMFQIKKFGGLKPVCGTTAVTVSGVENVDVTDLVSGHQDYCYVAGDILKRVRHGQPFQLDTKTFDYELEEEPEAIEMERGDLLFG